MAPRWMPSPVVPPWMSAMSDRRASWQNFQASLRRARARTQPCTRPLRVEPWLVRCR